MRICRFHSLFSAEAELHGNPKIHFTVTSKINCGRMQISTIRQRRRSRALVAYYCPPESLCSWIIDGCHGNAQMRREIIPVTFRRKVLKISPRHRSTNDLQSVQPTCWREMNRMFRAFFSRLQSLKRDIRGGGEGRRGKRRRREEH